MDNSACATLANYFSSKSVLYILSSLLFIINFDILDGSFFTTNENITTFISFSIIFLLSIIIIDFLLPKIIYNKNILCIFIIFYFTRKYFFINYLANNDFERGVMVGNFFYSPFIIFIFPYIANYIRVNIDNHKIKIYLFLISFSSLEYIIDILVIHPNILKYYIYRDISAMASYIFSLMLFIIIKNKFLKDNKFMNHLFLKFTRLILSLFGLPVFFLFLIFA